ncbi:Y-family DNA polymerase [Mucilaginibacter antarcticus]|uniref:Y-family DNA polymerase n=1 Tax=Mucilaginibacter antarcticus TaxID=1855725 RepID=UPI00363599E7
MQKRFVSLWFRHLLTDWLTLRQPELKLIPFVLVAPERNRIIITATNILAEQQGITVGMASADAKAIIPDLKVIDQLPEKADKLLNRLGEWCIRYTPQVALDAPCSLIMDVSGCTHLWGSEQQYLAHMLNRFRAKGYDVQAAMADTIGAAWAVAHFGNTDAVIPPNDHIKALLPLPPIALRLDYTALERLRKLGFYAIKSFLSIKRSALRRRFGNEFLLRIDEALGNVDEPLQLIHPIEAYHERLPSLEPIRTVEGIEIAIKTLLQSICERLRDEGKGLRTAVLKCYRVDGGLVGADIGTNRPSHNIEHLFKLFALKIDSIEPALGIELFTLDAYKIEDVSQDQEVLWVSDSCDLHSNDLAELLDRVGNKIGIENIRRYLPYESYWPERALRKATSLTEKPATTWRTGRPRPSIILPRPEPIQVTFKLPDDPQYYSFIKANGMR